MAAAVMHRPKAPRDAGHDAQAAARHSPLLRQAPSIDESDNNCLILCLEHWLEQLRDGVLDEYAVPWEDLESVAGVSSKAFDLVKGIAALLPEGDRAAWKPAIVLQGIKTILVRTREQTGAVHTFEAPRRGCVTALMVAQLEAQIGTSASIGFDQAIRKIGNCPSLRLLRF